MMMFVVRPGSAAHAVTNPSPVAGPELTWFEIEADTQRIAWAGDMPAPLGACWLIPPRRIPASAAAGLPDASTIVQAIRDAYATFGEGRDTR
jgi:hypothetical protein